MEAWGALVGGIGGALAFILGAVIYTLQRYDAIRDHATHISLWMDPTAPEAPTVFNSSLQAIHQVEPIFTEGRSLEPLIKVDRYSVLPPGERRRSRITPEIAGVVSSAGIVGLAVTFTDRAGRRWTRWSGGALRRAK